MKIICHREAFLSACQLASSAVPTKDVKPVLRNIKAEADQIVAPCCNRSGLGLRMEVGAVEVKRRVKPFCRPTKSSPI